MGYAIPASVTLDTETCISCGTTFAIETGLLRQRRRDHQFFYCPNGHSQCYPGKSDIELAREEATRERTARVQAEAAARIAREDAERARTREARLKKRVANGVCPCCQRSFTNLRRHITMKHPNFAPPPLALPAPKRG